MAEVLPFDKILARLDVPSLLKYKRVCKSWYSLISSSPFAKAHLINSCNNHHAIELKKIAIGEAGCKSLTALFRKTRHHIVGSSNGLLCIYLCDNELEVVNPYTRDVRKLPRLTEIPKRAILCCGFGYDSSTDDYKVIVGFKKLKITKFYVFKLRSNSWEFIKDVNYEFIEYCNHGILYQGTINWLMKDQNKKKIILSFDLTKEGFKEIRLPYDSKKSQCLDFNRLGVTDDDQFMLIYRNELYQTIRYKWVMENNTVKESWKLNPHDRELSGGSRAAKVLQYNPHENFYFSRRYATTMKLWDYKFAPMFVESLISPHTNRIHAKEEGDLTVKTAVSGRRKRRKLDLQSI